MTCAVEAHYQLNYIRAKNAAGEKVCRACYWRAWTDEQRKQPWNEFKRLMFDLLREYTSEQILEMAPAPHVREFLESEWWPMKRIIGHLDKHGFDLIATTADVNDRDDPVIIQCRSCQKLSAERLSDIGNGCTCLRNTRASNPLNPRLGRVLLVESQSPALEWWDYERNDERTLRTATVNATRMCHWVCPECKLRFEAKVNDMTNRPYCPECEAKRKERRRAEWQAKYERWKVTPVADVPELATAWADEADPHEVMVVGSWQLRRFRCPKGHKPRSSPLSFLESGCPHCRGAETARNKRWLADTLPEIASQWHPTRNGRLTPQNVVWNSTRVVWWRADCCGHEWQETVRSRDMYQRLRCPSCRAILGSLAWQNPRLAAEWSPKNPISSWQVRPHATTGFVPEWVCAENPEHVWQATVSVRSNGAECPECRESGKSRIEREHYAAAAEVFGAARSGVTVQDDAFASRSSWTTDIIVMINGHAVVIEYDGAYWHSAPDKALVDKRKSEDLLAAGYAVVRLREGGLPTLAIDNTQYLELRVYSTVPRPYAVMKKIEGWIGELP